jgi:SET domain-containing protein
MTKEASYYINDSAIQGKGLFAKRDISPQECIIDVLGERMTPEEIELDGLFSKKSANAYRFSKDLYISPTGHPSELINHSCSPNSYISKIDDELRILAGILIPLGTEILIDYSTIVAADDFWEMDCNCGSANCRELIKRFMDLPEAIQEEYKHKNWVPKYILEI